jgi:hypothetical protein
MAGKQCKMRALIAATLAVWSGALYGQPTWSEAPRPKSDRVSIGADGSSGVPETSTFFSTVHVDEATMTPVLGNGDLWPSCWGDDDALYTANGDGWGMDVLNKNWADIKVSRVTGDTPGFLSGAPLASGTKLHKSGQPVDTTESPLEWSALKATFI